MYRSRLGRLLEGLAESPVALTVLGASTAVARLLVTGTVGSNQVVFEAGSDFLYDSLTHVMTWRRGTKRGVTISFDFSTSIAS